MPLLIIVDLCAMAAEDGYAFPRTVLPEGA